MTTNCALILCAVSGLLGACTAQPTHRADSTSGGETSETTESMESADDLAAAPSSGHASSEPRPIDGPSEAHVEQPAEEETRILVPANQGTLERQSVRRVVRDHREDVSACYVAGLADNPSLEGQVTVRFVVGPGGEVVQVDASATTLDDPRVGQCIAAAMQDWEFEPPTPPGSSALVIYPYELSTR